MNEAALTDLHDLLTAEYRRVRHFHPTRFAGVPYNHWKMPDIEWLEDEYEQAAEAGKLLSWLDDWNWFKGLT